MRPLPWLRYPNPTAAFLLFAVALAQAPTARPAAAQTDESLPVVTQLPASTRAMALGDAYMMNAGHADAIFYHPALLTGAGGFGLDVQRWRVQGTAAAASAATQWLGGGIGVGLLSLQYEAPSTGAGAAPGGQAFLFRQGSEQVSERVAVLGYARELFGVDIGVAGKLVEERVGPDQEAVVLFDIGAAREVGPVQVGLTVKDIGDDPLVPGADATPRVLLGAGAYGQDVGILDMGATIAAEWSEDRTTVSGGVEIGYWPINGRTFVARIGLETNDDDMSPLTFGLAFWGDDVTVEGAFQPYGGDESAGTYRVGVRWR
jgi:hypothetical protein